MMDKFKNIEPKVAGLRCEIQVCNQSGHDVLTTFDPAETATVVDAQTELVAFWDSCIEEFTRGGTRATGLKPLVNGRRPGTAEGETELLDVKAPDFDLRKFEQVTIMPYPLCGG